MSTLLVDVAVLGAGTAGLTAYRAAVAAGARALLIGAGPHGTTCARVGCMPSKLLIAAADAAHAVARAHMFGVGATGRCPVAGRQVMARVRRERDRFVRLVLENIDRIPAADRMLGRARFIDDHTLAVGDARVRAHAVIIATGARPVIVPMLSDLGDRCIVSDDVFSWETLPASIAVFGPGGIGLELGQALARLGVRVGMFGVGGLVGPLTDHLIGAAAAEILGPELALLADAQLLGVRRSGDGVEVSLSTAGPPDLRTYDLVLAATGRTPNLDGLGLEQTTLARDERGVPIFDRTTLQCGSSAIFIAGDADADVPVLHEATDEGALAGRNAARFPLVEPGVRRSPLAIVFTDPQIATVGASWAELQARDPVVGRVSFDDQGRARMMGVNRGLLHLYADRTTGRLLGAEMIAPHAEHLAHLLAWAHQLALTVPEILALPFYHPVLEEGLRTALRGAEAQLGQPSRSSTDDEP